MDLTASAGLAPAWVAAKRQAADQAVQLAVVKQRADAEKRAADMLERAAERRSPPAPPGQGTRVDTRA
jgi:hypothetical protein